MTYRGHPVDYHFRLIDSGLCVCSLVEYFEWTPDQMKLDHHPDCPTNAFASAREYFGAQIENDVRKLCADFRHSLEQAGVHLRDLGDPDTDERGPLAHMAIDQNGRPPAGGKMRVFYADSGPHMPQVASPYLSMCAVCGQRPDDPRFHAVIVYPPAGENFDG